MSESAGKMPVIDKPRLADEIARKYFHSHEQCGGGFHYDSCQRCNLRNDIENALQLVREDEQQKGKNAEVENKELAKRIQPPGRNIY